MNFKKRIITLLQYIFLVGIIVATGRFGLHEISTVPLTWNAYENLASIATMSVAVAPNEYSMLAQQFTQKEGELTAREHALLLREEALGAKYQEEIDANKRSTLLLFAGTTLLLLLLILFNFFLDLKREKNPSRPNEEGHHGEFTTRLTSVHE